MNGFEALLAWVFAAIGAAVNSVAGGGTFLTFPLLTFIGMTALQANIVSTIALWPGIASSAVAYRSHWVEVKHLLPKLVLVSFLGSIIGSFTLLSTPEKQFAMLVPWLMLVATLLFTFGKYLKLFAHAHRPRHSQLLSLCCQFIIGFYGGYFGAGIGILMLAVLQFYPLRDIHQMNAVKTVLGTTINGVAFFIFLFSGHVIWEVALWMLTGGIAGGYIGTRLALKVQAKLMRRVIMVIAWVMTAWFFVT